MGLEFSALPYPHPLGLIRWASLLRDGHVGVKRYIVEPTVSSIVQVLPDVVLVSRLRDRDVFLMDFKEASVKSARSQ